MCVHGGRSVSAAGTQFNFPTSVITGEDQSAIFQHLGDPVLTALAGGRNATIIAYGQTGSGKTHTMLGPRGSLTIDAIQQVRHSLERQVICGRSFATLIAIIAARF